MQNLHDIENEKIVLNEEGKVSLEFLIPETSDFFNGHFPEFKLLPAVAQFEIITRFSRKYLGTQRYVPNIKRIKFSNPIRPNTNIHLDLSLNEAKQTVSFTMMDANAEIVDGVEIKKTYSSGSFNILKEEK